MHSTTDPHSTTPSTSPARERRIHEAIHSRRMEGIHCPPAPHANDGTQAADGIAARRHQSSPTHHDH
jgi:hypothetical protein